MLPFQNAINGAQQGFKAGYKIPGADSNKGQAASGLFGGLVGAVDGLVNSSDGRYLGEITTDPKLAPTTNTGTQLTNEARQNIGLYDQAIGQANAGIGRLDQQQQIGLQNVQGDYQNNLDRLLNAKNNTQKQYGESVVNTKQDNLTARSNVDFETGQRANALQRLLGSKGAGSSSAARIAAPYAAALEGTQQLNQVGDAFKENMGALDTSWGNYQTGWNQSKEDLDAQKVNQERAVQSDVATKRADLLSNLSTLAAQRAQAAGGNAATAAQPYLDQVNGLYSQINNLGAQYQGRVNVADPTYQAPELSQYDYNQRGQIGVAQNAQQQGISPYLSILLGQKDRKQNLA